MAEKLLFKAENVFFHGRGSKQEPFSLELKAGQGALVVARELDFLRRLMRCCLGQESIDGGSLSWWTGTSPSQGWDKHDFYRRIGYVDRQSELLGALTLGEHFDLLCRYALDSCILEECDSLLKIFGLEPYTNYKAGDLPEPQRRLALYALAFCRRPYLLLMERPIQFLDFDFQLVWRLVLSRAAETGMAYMVFDRSESIYRDEHFDGTVLLGQR